MTKAKTRWGGAPLENRPSQTADEGTSREGDVVQAEAVTTIRSPAKTKRRDMGILRSTSDANAFLTDPSRAFAVIVNRVDDHAT